MKKFLFILLSACVLLSACKKDPIQITKDKLVGTWTEKAPIIGWADSLRFDADNTLHLFDGSNVTRYSFASPDSIVFNFTNGTAWLGFKIHFVTDTELIIDRYQTDFVNLLLYPITLKKQE